MVQRFILAPEWTNNDSLAWSRSMDIIFALFLSSFHGTSSSSSSNNNCIPSTAGDEGSINHRTIYLLFASGMNEKKNRRNTHIHTKSNAANSFWINENRQNINTFLFRSECIIYICAEHFWNISLYDRHNMNSI